MLQNKKKMKLLRNEEISMGIIWWVIVPSVITTLLVIWGHFILIFLWDWWHARCLARKHFNQNRQVEASWRNALPTEPTLPPMEAVFTPLRDTETLCKLMKHEVGLRVKKSAYVEGMTDTGEQRVAEEIRDLKRKTIRLQPL
jgi:hypothetical protein